MRIRQPSGALSADPGRLLVLLFAALALVLAAGCSKPPKLTPLANDAVVLAFGDSLTYGTGANEAESYPAQLAGLIGRNVVRAGVPGEMTAGALARLPSALEAHAPKLLLLCIGGNDFLRGQSKAEAERNIREMVKLARGQGIDVLLIGAPERGLTVTPPGFYAEVAKDHGIPYEGAIVGELLRDADMKSDAIHPNARGYRAFAERIAKRLKESGAL